jgi:hypothetical protein
LRESAKGMARAYFQCGDAVFDEAAQLIARV